MSKDERLPSVGVSHDGETHTTAQVARKEQTGLLELPYCDVSIGESIALGFRMTMFSIGDDEDERFGEVSSGSGFGTDFIQLKWGEKHAFVRGIDLLIAWVNLFDPKSAEAMKVADPYRE